MNAKRFWLAGVAVFVVYQAMIVLIHGVWLAPVYEEYAGVFGSEAEMRPMPGKEA